MNKTALPVYDDTGVIVIDRDEFMADYWDYKPGQHVTIIGPNGRGKTTLGLDLLGKTANKDMPAFVLVSKPRDETIDRYTKKLKFKTIQEYPPGMRWWRKPNGYMVRPHQTLTDLEGDEQRLRSEFRATMRGCYASPQARIVFADEVQELQSPGGLKLQKECNAYWKRGRSLKSGLWACAQRSAHNSQDMYNAPEHLFLFSDPDKRNRVRFSEIGGVDPDLVMDTVYNLEPYQSLYIKRTGPCLCVVNP